MPAVFPDIDAVVERLRLKSTNANPIPPDLTNAITAWRQGAISRIETFYCEQPIAAATVSYEFTPMAKTPSYTPPYFPLRGITELKEVLREEAGFTAFTSLQSSDFGVAKGAIVKRNGFEPSKTYLALLHVGYEEIPPEIIEIFFEMITVRHKESNFATASRLGISNISESLAGTNVMTTFRNMHENWQERLARFRPLPV